VYRLVLESIQHIERVVHSRSRSIVLHVIVDRNVRRRGYLVSLLLNVHGRAILSEEEHHDSGEAALAAFKELEGAILRCKNNRNRRNRLFDAIGEPGTGHPRKTGRRPSLG
jgi:ribosome-associated translation inhibitor RaiA